MSLEQEIIDRALYYEENPKEQSESKSGKANSWYKKIHQHFQNDLSVEEDQEHFVEYYPIQFLFGETSSYKQGVSSGRMYKSKSGIFGTGYICFTDKNIYITAIDSLTQEYPLYEGGANGFLFRVLEGFGGEMNDRKAYKGNKTWVIDYPSVLGAQITQSENSGDEIVYMKTSVVDWQIYEHFTNTLPEILTIIKMGKFHKLAKIWATPEQAPESKQNNSDIPDLLKKLSELKEAGVITEAEFQQKKKELLNKM